MKRYKKILLVNLIIPIVIMGYAVTSAIPYLRGKEPKYDTVSTMTTFNNFTAEATQCRYKTAENNIVNGSWDLWLRNPIDYEATVNNNEIYIDYFRQPNSNMTFYGIADKGQSIPILTVYYNQYVASFAYTKGYNSTEYPNFQYYNYTFMSSITHDNNDLRIRYDIKVYAELYYEKTETTYYDVIRYDILITHLEYGLLFSAIAFVAVWLLMFIIWVIFYHLMRFGKWLNQPK